MSLLAIRSKDREPGGTSSDFRIRLQQPIQGAFSLAHVLVPHSMYTVRASCNTLSLSQGGGLHTFEVEPGFYDASSLCAAVEQALRGATGNPQFACVFSALTGRVTISSSSTFSLLWGGLANSIAPLLGFDATSTGFATSHTGSGLLDLTHRSLGFQIVVEAPGVAYGVTNTRGHHSSFMISNEEDAQQYTVWEAWTGLGMPDSSQPHPHIQLYV